MTIATLPAPITSDIDDDVYHVHCEVCWPGDEVVALCGQASFDSDDTWTPATKICPMCADVALHHRGVHL